VGSEQHLLLLVEYRGGRPLKEPVHAAEVGPGVFRLRYAPGLAQGIAAGDEFRLVGEDGAFEVTRRGGNLAVQVFSTGPVAAVRAELAARVAPLGGTLDGAIERGLSFTVPVSAGFPAVEAVFNGWGGGAPGLGVVLRQRVRPDRRGHPAGLVGVGPNHRLHRAAASCLSR
jgi:hypothetical protein